MSVDHKRSSHQPVMPPPSQIKAAVRTAVLCACLIPLAGLADPAIVDYRNGWLAWSNAASSGFHTIEWANSLTGTWYRSWKALMDIPAVPGITEREVPMFYRVAWSPTSSVVTLPSLPLVSGFTASGGENYVGLSWTVPVASNVAGVSIARDSVWYPDDPNSGTLVYWGVGNSTVDLQVTEGTKYYYKAFTYDGNGNFSLGVTATAIPVDTVAPPNVSSLSALAGDHVVNLGWRNPVSSDFAGVRLMRTTGSPPTGPAVGTLVYAGLGTNVMDTGLSNGTFYYYKAYSFDAVPNYSSGTAASALPLNTLPPGNVAGVSAVAGDERVTLTWSNPTGGDFLGVRIQRKVGTAPTSPADGVTVHEAGGTTLTNLSLVNGTEYFYRLFAYDEVPNYASGVVTSAIPLDTTAPGPVSNVVVMPVPGNITIRWVNPPDLDLAGVRVLRKTTGYPTNATDGVTVYQGSGTNTADTALSDGVDTNYYRVYAFDEVPNYAGGTTGILVRPRPVSGLRAIAGDEQVTLNWTNPAIGNFSGVRIQRTAGAAPTNAMDGVTVYEGTGTAFTNVNLANNTQYFYAAFTFDALPHYSTGVTISATSVDVTAPGAVTLFTVTAVPGNTALAWVNPVDLDLAGVRVLRKTTGYPANATDGVTVFQGTGTNAVDTPLAEGVAANYYRAFAFDEVPNYNTGVNGLLTRQANVTGFTAVSGDQKVTLTWGNPGGPGFAGVRIQRDVGRAPTNAMDGSTVYEGQATSFTNSGLVNLTDYRYSAFCFDQTPNYSTGVTTNGTPADVTAPAVVTALAVAPIPGGIGLSWVNPVDADLAGVRVLRKTMGYPSNTTDGVTVFDGIGTNVTDNPMTDGVGTNYYRAFAFDEVPNFSAGVNGLVARQSGVSGFSATPRDEAVFLRWTNPVSANFAGVTIQQSTNGTPTNALDGSTVYVGTGNNFTNGPLPNAVRYYYAAYAFDATPNYSSGLFTNAMPADTNAPANVTNLVADSSNGTVFLSWVNPGDADLAGVRVQRKIGTSPTNYADGVTVFDGLVANATDTGLTNGTNYCYRIFAHDEVPNYASGIAITSMPLRTLFIETFEDAGGWTDHTNRQWTQTASSGVWVVTGQGVSYGGFYAMTNATYAHSGVRWLRSVGSYDCWLEIPPSDNPMEVSAWVRTPGFATSGSLSLYFYDGFAWYYLNSRTINGDQYTNVVFKTLLNGHSGQQLRFYTSDPLYIDDIEIRVAP